MDDDKVSPASLFPIGADFSRHRRAEAQWRDSASRRSANFDLFSPEALEHLMHELQVHQMELEMENEELRRSQLALDVERARYFDFYDMAPVGYCSVTEKGLISQANLAAVALLGLPRSELIKQPFSRFIFRQDQDSYYLFRHKLLASGASISCELRLINPGGEPYWALMDAQAVTDEQGKPELRIVLSDITARKQAERLKQTLLDEKVALLHEMKVRVRAVTMLHESLQRLDILASVDLSASLRHVATEAFHAHALHSDAMRLTLELASVRVSLDQAALCGLLVSELISNVFKHAVPAGRSGEICVHLQPAAAGTAIASKQPQVVEEPSAGALWCLRINPKGVASNADLEANRGQSPSLQLVDDLCKQIGGTLAIDPAPQGAFAVTFAIQPMTQPTSPAAV